MCFLPYTTATPLCEDVGYFFSLKGNNYKRYRGRLNGDKVVHFCGQQNDIFLQLMQKISVYIRTNWIF